MNISKPFITRPVATALLCCGLALAGIASFFLLPVSPMPNVDFPAIVVSASLPGASPETVATSVTTPLERHLSGIAGVSQMTSQSSEGSSRIILIFNLNRSINGAASDVEAAIQAARVDLPSSLRSNPTYRKINPSEQPILILALRSDTMSIGKVYDVASTIVAQRLLQVDGVGDVSVGGSSLPAVRVDLNPRALFKYGIGLEDVRAALAAANANAPKGAISTATHRYQIYVNDKATNAAEYRPLIIAYRKGAPVRLQDIASVTNGVENIRNLGLIDGNHPAVLLIIQRQPGANVVKVVDRIKSVLPAIRASIPGGIQLIETNDRTQTIRASLHDVEETLLIAVALVITVVFLMLRNARAALVPTVAVPLSLIGTFGIMYLLGFSLDNLSLMALTVATGFVVDDAIVVVENISRHVERGVPRLQAALIGAREVGFTVLAMSSSLVAVFVPIMFMGGLVGRVFTEFALTIVTAIVISLLISLTATPTMCGHLLAIPTRQGRLFAAIERGFNGLRSFYGRTLAVALDHPRTVMMCLLAVIFANFYLLAIVPKGFFPRESTGALMGFLRADQSISFQAMQAKLRQVVNIVKSDPAVEHVVGFTQGGGRGGGGNTARMFVDLKPLGKRKLDDTEVIARLRRELSPVTGARLFLFSPQDIRAGGRQSFAQYQYTLESDNLNLITKWTPRITKALRNLPELRDVNSDRQASGLDVRLHVNRETASRLGVNITQIDNTLYDAFGQRMVSTIYKDMNQYHVIMEVEPSFWQSPETLKEVYVSDVGGALSGTQLSGAPVGTVQIGSSNALSAGAFAAQNRQLNALVNSGPGGASTGFSVATRSEQMVPLADFASYGPGLTPMAINHQGPFVAETYSFNLPDGVSLGVATAAIQNAMDALHVPIEIHGEFAGTAQVFRQTLEEEPLLVLAALVAVYIVLGILYESLVQPLTIISTLPSAGIGAVLALILFGKAFSLIALIGVILLIGIVLKNAIMMVDVALDTQRREGTNARRAVHEACLLRFRPIMMTTMAAMFGAVPLAVMTGNGAELRQPLGISVVGGLMISQILTLYTTPVVYMYVDRFRRRHSRPGRPGQQPPASVGPDGSAPSASLPT